MKSKCPNPSCFYFNKNTKVIKDGYYRRKDDSRTIARFICTQCGKKFSAATSKLEYRQKKRRINNKILILLSSSVSMRRIAKVLNINQLTVKRKLIYLAKKSNISHQKFLESLKQNPVTELQFDDLLTIEHTKMKPLSVSIAVDANRRKILGAKVSQIPAFGLLAKKSVKKYGYRKSGHSDALKTLFTEIQSSIRPDAIIKSDEHKAYPSVIHEFFPQGTHKSYKGGRGAVSGQGELKKLHYDPLFILNHTCAMMRDNIKRLVRKTWCTTKDPLMLQKHIDVYINYHNTVLTS